ncbi:MAG TPA: glycoside hydrolase family 2 TIM barrel-domain containing protein [Thermoanaerobaculia bacterium]|nr:glycoside hydrolase family 2 TIM barrel-domain containing protein [Thermoanaerobaculia bacterium]
MTGRSPDRQRPCGNRAARAGGARRRAIARLGLARWCTVAAIGGLASPAPAPALAIESERLYLSGQGPADAVPWQFQVSSGRRAGEWSTIAVPSQWELQGFGTYRYGLDDPGADEEGRYRVRFTPPASWAERRIVLVFEGCMTDCAPALNGRPLDPVHRGGFTRFSYDVTAPIRLGVENLLEVHVLERSEDRSVERAERRADYWLFGGIYRPVYLEAIPLPGIDRVRIDARHDGRLTVAVDVVGAEGPAQATLHGEVRERPSGALVHRFTAGGGDRILISERIDGIRAWSAEEPWLYELRLTLESEPTVGAGIATGADGEEARRGPGAGEPGHQRTEVFGFRTFAVVPGKGLLVNGRRVLLKGINRHSFWPTTGRALDAAINRRDAELIRAMNANAVRTSHYPPDPELLRACDEIGLYVIDELPGWHDAYRSAVGRRLVREMVDRDHNHPSVVAWANGNEGGWNPDLDGEFARHDLQARPVLHPGDLFGGVDASHYPSWDDLRASLDPVSWRNRWRRLWGPLPVVLPTEALHGLYDGGLGAGLEDYWALVRASPLAGGLFLWTFVDEGVVRGDRDGALDTFANYGPDGIVGPFREQEGSFWAVRDTWSPIAILERELELAGRSEARLTVENRYDLADLEGARLGWEWLRFPEPGGHSERVLERGSTELPPIAPRQRGTIALPAAVSASPPDALRLRALDRSGREVSAYVLALRDGREAQESEAAGPAAAMTSGGQLVLTAGETSVELDAARGRLLALAHGATRFVFDGGPRAVGEREPRLLEARPRRGDGGAGVEFRYAGALAEVGFTLERSGWLRVDYTLVVDQPTALQGLVLDVPEDGVSRLRWLGQGPFRVWGNRRQGGWLGVWDVERNDTVTGVEWGYPELGGFYAGVRWATLEADAGDLTLALEDPSLHLGVLEPRFAEGKGPDGIDLARHARTAVPGGGLAVLHAVPGIGTKFHTAEETGPQGRVRLAPGRYQGRFRMRLETRE